MASVVENVNLISTTMESILDFIANDETLSNDFKEYLELSNIELEGEKQFNNVIIQYMLDMKMQNGLRVLEYYRRNNKTYDDIIDALLNSFCCVFKIDKVLSNGYEATCLTSEAKLTLIPMVKMCHLKQIGKNDFILARILELNKVQYILEIHDIISEYNVYKSTVEAIRYMLQNPKCAYYKNEDKHKILEKSVEEFREKFNQCFKNQFIVTTNKCVDELIEYCNKYRLGELVGSYEHLIQKTQKNQYLKIDEFNCDDATFMQKAVGGFSSHKETYDVGLWMDKKRGLYIIPFLETFFKCFSSEDIPMKNECVKEFLTSDKIPPSVIKYACENYNNFFEVINKALKTKFTNLEEVLFNTKTAFLDEGIFSPVTVLFNSDLFSSLIDYNEVNEQKEEEKNVGRNELCPCGSGLKYKNCCAKNI